MILVLIGEGKVMTGKEAMEKAGTKPVKLDFKEGLALNNGTQLMTAMVALTINDAKTSLERRKLQLL